jgi:hypothetical protein
VWGTRGGVDGNLVSSRLYLNSENILEGVPDQATSSLLVGISHKRPILVPTIGIADINVYSFALHPEQVAPSGTCNFSQVDQCFLEVVLKGRPDTRVALVVFGKSYNVLRVRGGVGWMMFQHN